MLQPATETTNSSATFSPPGIPTGTAPPGNLQEPPFLQVSEFSRHQNNSSEAREICIRERRVTVNQSQKPVDKSLDRVLTKQDIPLINSVLQMYFRDDITTVVEALPFSPQEQTRIFCLSGYTDGRRDYTDVLEALISKGQDTKPISWNYLAQALKTQDGTGLAAAERICQFGRYPGHTSVFGSDEYLNQPLRETDLPVLAEILGRSLENQGCLNHFFFMNRELKRLPGCGLSRPAQNQLWVLQRLLVKRPPDAPLTRRVVINALAHPFVEEFAIADALISCEDALTRPLQVNEIPAIVELLSLPHPECPKLLAALGMSSHHTNGDAPAVQTLSNGLERWTGYSATGNQGASLYNLLTGYRAAGLKKNRSIENRLLDKGNLLYRPITHQDIEFLVNKMAGIPHLYHNFLIQLGGAYNTVMALSQENPDKTDFLIQGLDRWIRQSDFTCPATLGTLYNALRAATVKQYSMARDCLLIDRFSLIPGSEPVDVAERPTGFLSQPCQPGSEKTVR